jgi:hypothetical protein
MARCQSSLAFSVPLRFCHVGSPQRHRERQRGLQNWRVELVWILLSAFHLVNLATLSAADSADQRFLDGLRHRRLFQLAEKHCEQRLQDSKLETWERGTITIELVRTYAEHAANASSDQRPSLWKKADDAAIEFLRTRPNDPQQVLIKTQQALSILARGELARLESEIAADPRIALAEAREVIRQAAKMLESLDAELVLEIAARRRIKAVNALTADELSSLLHHVRYERARAARNQALSYASGTPDHIAALSQAIDLLDEPLRETVKDEPLGCKVRLEVAICQRLLREHESAEQTLQELDSDAVPTDIRLSARAENVRLALGMNRTDEALRLLSLGRGTSGQILSPELDFAHLETYVALWQAAADAKQATETEKWRNQAIQAVQLIEQTHGPYWARRAEILLVRVGGERSGGSVEILRRAADDFYLKGQLDEALATYDKASAAARSANELQSAFELAYKGALLEQKRSLYANAATRFRELSVAMKNHLQAPNAHLLAIVNEAQIWKADSTRRNQYVGLLEEHVAIWPDSATASRASLWLGGVFEREQAWEKAVTAYRAVHRSSEQSDEAVRGADRCWNEWFRVRTSAGENIEAAVADAVSWFEAGFVVRDGGLPNPWTASQRNMLLAAARLRLKWTSGDRKVIEMRLRRALEDQPEPSLEWSADARALLVLALAGQPGREMDARQVISQLGNSPPEQLLGIVRQLGVYQVSATDPTRTDLAKLQLLVLDRLPGDLTRLPPELQVEIVRLRSRALLGASDPKGAISEFAKLVREQSRDGNIQAEFGDLLLASPDSADWQRALEQWRIVASKSEPRTRRWFRAKFGVAQAQFQLGNKEESAKLIRYLHATENLAGSGLEKEFLELLRKCEAK